MKVAVIGGGWAGLAAAVRATELGHSVTLLEMAAQLGGRARGVEVGGAMLDNGQHILIGAYRRTLALMATVGVESDAVFDRRPLTLRYPDGSGLRLPRGPAVAGFVRGVLAADGLDSRDRWSLLQAAAGWMLRRFRCPPALTVDALCRSLRPAVRGLLIDPLCIAALNTPAVDASAAVLLRVLRDALFGGAGGADLLLPRTSLHDVLPAPAERWLRDAGCKLAVATRVRELQRVASERWLVDGHAFDEVILACTATEAARLARPHAPAFADAAAALEYEPIVTVYLMCPGAVLMEPMMVLREGPDAPAQFAFDHGALGATPGVFAFVISGARRWVEAGLDATGAAVLRQAHGAFGASTWPEPPRVLRVLAEKRATFRCTPGLRRPPRRIAPGLQAAGDHVDGPYPATLEGAVRSGEAAARALGDP